jgi:hypothetical protein
VFHAQLIAEPYKGPVKALPIHTLFTAAGWRERWNRVRAAARAALAAPDTVCFSRHAPRNSCLGA